MDLASGGSRSTSANSQAGTGWWPRESWMWFAGMALFGVLLAITVGEVLNRDHAEVVIAAQLVAMAVFVAIFMRLALTRRVGERIDSSWVFVVLGAIAVAISVLSPGEGLFLGTLSALGGLYLAPRPAIGVIVAAALLGLVTTLFEFQSSTAITHTAQTAAIGFFCFGWARLQETNQALGAAREEVARLAVADERVRFARDLHDLLGHTLSVIRVKSELAVRLARTEPERAAAEMADVELVSRSALAEVRQAVAGYRLDLSLEMERAEVALRAAGIEPTVVGAEVLANGPVGETLAWVIREATTNVLRHSRAGRCSIVMSRGSGTISVTVEDDGVGLIGTGVSDGRGTQGMRERLAGLGGQLEIQAAAESGYLLCATVPEPHP